MTMFCLFNTTSHSPQVESCWQTIRFAVYFVCLILPLIHRKLNHAGRRLGSQYILFKTGFTDDYVLIKQIISGAARRPDLDT